MTCNILFYKRCHRPSEYLAEGKGCASECAKQNKNIVFEPKLKRKIRIFLTPKKT